jgi:hypothetical protein
MRIDARDIIQKKLAGKCEDCGEETEGTKKCLDCSPEGTMFKKPKESRQAIAAQLRKIARPPFGGLGMPAEPREMTSPSLEDGGEGGGMGMEEETPQEPGQEEGDDLPTMVSRISNDYLSDEKMGEIQKAIMGLMGHVPPESATDVAENFGKFMEAAFMLKADLQKLTIMGTPQNSLQQISPFPEEQQQGLRTDVLT